MNSVAISRLGLTTLLAISCFFVSPVEAWQEEDPVVVEKIDPAVYQVPDTDDVVELERFIDGLLRLRPANGQEYLQHIDLMPPAVDEAARKIISLSPDSASLGYRKASYMTIVARVFALNKLQDGEIATLLEEIGTRLENPDYFSEAAGLAAQVAERLESIEKVDLAKQAYLQFGTVLSQSDEKDLADHGQRMLGAARRLDLVGSPLELSGKLTSDKDLDWSQFSGKVVLVDYWASWCGPCLADFPRLVKARQAYGERGFEIVGICLDKDLDRVVDTMAEGGVTWPCLFEEDAAWNHPMVLKYGISQIPSTILVGRDGRVIDLNLRGEALEAKLAELFGEASIGNANE